MRFGSFETTFCRIGNHRNLRIFVLVMEYPSCGILNPEVCSEIGIDRPIMGRLIP